MVGNHFKCHDLSAVGNQKLKRIKFPGGQGDFLPADEYLSFFQTEEQIIYLNFSERRRGNVWRLLLFWNNYHRSVHTLVFPVKYILRKRPLLLFIQQCEQLFPNLTSIFGYIQYG